MAIPSISLSPAPQSTRPTLPPLSSLGLLDIRARRQTPHVPAMNITNNTNSNDLLQAPLPLEFNQHWPRGRQCSVSSTTSSCTTSSRASSPTDAWPARRSSIPTRTIRRHHPYFPADKYRAVLSDSYMNADAMLVVPLPPDVVDENNKPILEKLRNFKADRAYLVVGPIANDLRDPKNRARLRAAVHPYRFVPRDSAPASASASASASTSASTSTTAPPTIATPTLPEAMRRISVSSDVSDSEMSH